MEQQMNAATVILEQNEGVATITLNRPQVLNAMTADTFSELKAAVEQVSSDQSVQIVILRGAGGNFCSGADVSVLASLRNKEQADQALDIINSMLQTLHEMEKPVIAVIEGVAVGAGLNLALHADFVLASEDALLQEPFVHIGLTTDFGGTYLLPRLVGMAQAKRLALLGEKISGKEAERIGLIYKAVPLDALQPTVDELVEALRRLPKAAFQTTKRGLASSGEFTFLQTLAWEKEQQPKLILHPEFQQAIQARFKRK